MKTRDKTYDIARAFGIFFVMLGHMPSIVPEYLRLWIFTFHMPFFYILGGVFARPVDSISEMPGYIKDKAKAYLLPYIIYSVTFFVMDALTGRIMSDEYLLQIKFFFVGYAGVQWFLYSYFLVTVLFAFIMLIKPESVKMAIFFVMPVAAVIIHYAGLPNYGQLGSALYGMGFYGFGYVLWRKIQRKTWIFCVTITVSLCAGLGFVYIRNSGVLDMKRNTEIDVILNYALALCGSYWLFYISGLFRRENILTRWLCHVGRYSVVYFALTWYLPGLMVHLFRPSSALMKLGLYAVTFVLLYVAIMLYERIHCMTGDSRELQL